MAKQGNAAKQKLSFRQQVDAATGVDCVRLILGRKKPANVSPKELAQIEKGLATVTREEATELFADDRMLSNFILNIWEWAHGATVLESLPWNVSLPISDVCNARCAFCTSWLDGQHQITLDQLAMFEPVLRTAVYVGLIGHGEPLAHPRLGDIAARLEEYLDPRAVSYTITNGVYLEKWIDQLDRLRLGWLSCSLNAATSETHQKVMGLAPGDFSRIVDNLTALAAGRGITKPIVVHITLVVTRDNLHEVPAFIALGHRIGATSIYLRTLLPQGRLVEGLNYHMLPAYLHPDFDALRANAAAAIRESSIPVHAEPDTWSSPIFPEPLARQIEAATPVFISRADALRDRTFRFARNASYESANVVLRGAPSTRPDLADTLKDETSPLNRRAPFRCRAVYYNMYVNELFLRLSPCCYLTQTPGHDEVRLPHMADLMEAWNAESFRTLRHRLRAGPLFGACERCPETW